MTNKSTKGLLGEIYCLKVIFQKSEYVTTTPDHVSTSDISFEKTFVSDNDRDVAGHSSSQRPPLLSPLRQRSAETPKTHFGKC